MKSPSKVNGYAPEYVQGKTKLTTISRIADCSDTNRQLVRRQPNNSVRKEAKDDTKPYTNFGNKEIKAGAMTQLNLPVSIFQWSRPVLWV